MFDQSTCSRLRLIYRLGWTRQPSPAKTSITMPVTRNGDMVSRSSACSTPAFLAFGCALGAMSSSNFVMTSMKTDKKASLLTTWSFTRAAHSGNSRSREPLQDMTLLFGGNSSNASKRMSSAFLVTKRAAFWARR